MWFKVIFILIITILNTLIYVNCDNSDYKLLEKLNKKCLNENQFKACFQKKALEDLIELDNKYELSKGIQINSSSSSLNSTGDEDFNRYIIKRVSYYLKNHIMKINLADTYQEWKNENEITSRNGRNTFLTGFGLGFLAFALKKLLLPVFIGAQLVKTVLIAMFLPTILTGIGKFLGKSGAAVFSASSGPTEEFDFKDNNYDSATSYDTAASTNTATFTYASPQQQQQSPQNRFETAADFNKYYHPNDNKNKFYSLQNLYKKPPLFPSGQQLRRPQAPHSPFTQFNKIDSSALMLTEYDPFYSPLLSRLDVIFTQLGYQKEDDICREKLVCKMYKDPAKYVPYSNLVSAQLSRELSELEKPSSNKVLRFFKYMKAAKEGQDNNDCDELYKECKAPELQSYTGAKGADDSTGGITSGANPPMVQAYHDINKLVQAKRSLTSLSSS